MKYFLKSVDSMQINSIIIINKNKIMLIKALIKRSKG